MALKYRVNRYNWLCQKLLAQHEFARIIWLKQNMLSPSQHEGASERSVSDHLNYVHSLALLKTGTQTEPIIDTMQRLNFQQNSQYFLLLCQCLTYLGQQDSVVALCRQVIGRELNHAAEVKATLDEGHPLTMMEAREEPDKLENLHQSLGILMQQESFDTKKILANIVSSRLINDPRLWMIFGSALEHQLQLKDAQTAFRVAAKLAARKRKSSTQVDQETRGSIGLNNYYVPSIKYAEICARYTSHIKQAMQALFPSDHLYPQSINSSHILALFLCKQISGSKSGIHKAVELLTSLEAYLASIKNPAHAYNQISLSCRRKFSQDAPSQIPILTKEDEMSLDFVLAKSFVLINSLYLNGDHSSLSGDEVQRVMMKIVDQCIDSLRRSNATCWNSAALWNNLGVCYMIKKRNIASISCFNRAHNLNPLDWRINFNLALAFLEVAAISKASIHLMAAKNLCARVRWPKPLEKAYSHDRRFVDPIITVSMAICNEKLGELVEARRLYIEVTQLPVKNVTDAPVLSLINYLIFLHKHLDLKDEGSLKLQVHLLDRLEQYWLQRDRNAYQFRTAILEAASQIGEELSRVQGISTTKIYAWTKMDST